MKPPLCSATSVDVEEHLYRLATNMGITVITSSQVSVTILFFFLVGSSLAVTPQRFLLISEIRMTELLCCLFVCRGLL